MKPFSGPALGLQPLLLFCLLFCQAAVLRGADLPRVCIVHSYDPQNIVSIPQDQGIVEALAAAGFVDGSTVRIHRFYMDTKKTFTRPEQIEARGRAALEKIKTLKPDLVFTVDDNAARKVMLPLVDSSVPLVFTGINNRPELYNHLKRFMETREHPGHNVTGVYEKLYIGKSVQVMREILPDLEKIVFIVDDSPTGNAIRRQMEEELSDQQSGILYSIRQVGAFDEYKRLIRRINADPETGAYYPVAVRLSTCDNKIVTNLEILRWTLAHTAKPDLAVNYYACRLGLFGGVSVNFKAMGRQAGAKGAAVLKGSPAGSIAIEDAADYALVFNLARARQLKVTLPADLLGSADRLYETMQLAVDPGLPKILVIHSGSPDLGAEAKLARGMISRMARSGYVAGKNVEISRFFMQCLRRFTGPAQVRERGREALAEVERLKPDLVVLLGDAAAREVLPSLVDSPYPVLFGGTHLPPERYAAERPFLENRIHPGHNVSGVTGELEIRTSLEAALMAFPDTDKIVLLDSGTLLPRRWFSPVLEKECAAFAALHPGVEVRVEYAATIEEFKQLVLRSNNDGETDIVATVLPVGLVDRDGTPVPLQQTLRWLLANQKKPGLGFTDTAIRYGFLMGEVVNARDIGRQLGEQVVQVLHGADPADLAIESPEDTYLALNMARAEQLHLDLPLDIVEAAGKVYFQMETAGAR